MTEEAIELITERIRKRQRKQYQGHVDEAVIDELKKLAYDLDPDAEAAVLD